MERPTSLWSVLISLLLIVAMLNPSYGVAPQGKGCESTCRWKCKESKLCPTSCTPNCSLPDCSITCDEHKPCQQRTANGTEYCSSCETKCEQPICTTRCPKQALYHASPKPEGAQIACKADCLPPRCETLCRPSCEILCLPVKCNLQCAPDILDCTEPKCELECPASCHGPLTNCCPCTDHKHAKFAFASAMTNLHDEMHRNRTTIPSYDNVYNTFRFRQSQGQKQCCPCAPEHDENAAHATTIDVTDDSQYFTPSIFSPPALIELESRRHEARLKAIEDSLFEEFKEKIVSELMLPQIMDPNVLAPLDNLPSVLQEMAKNTGTSWKYRKSSPPTLEMIIDVPRILPESLKWNYDESSIHVEFDAAPTGKESTETHTTRDIVIPEVQKKETEPSVTIDGTGPDAKLVLRVTADESVNEETALQSISKFVVVIKRKSQKKPIGVFPSSHALPKEDNVVPLRELVQQIVSEEVLHQPGEEIIDQARQKIAAALEAKNVSVAVPHLHIKDT